MVKNLPANAGDTGLIPKLGRYLGEGNGNPLQYSFLEKEMATCSRNPGEFHGQRSLVGHSSWNCKESDTTKQLSTAQRLAEVKSLSLV